MRHKTCQFCRKHIEVIDYLDAKQLQRHLGTWSRVKPGRDTGTCTRHQRRLTEAMKRARFLAVMPYTTR